MQKDNPMLWVVLALVVGGILGFLLGRITQPYSTDYLQGTASMMSDKGNDMMWMGGMMMDAGQMMKQKGSMYNDNEMMQKGQEIEDTGQMMQTKGSEMMDWGNGMMRMME